MNERSRGLLVYIGLVMICAVPVILSFTIWSDLFIVGISGSIVAGVMYLIGSWSVEKTTKRENHSD